MIQDNAPISIDELGVAVKVSNVVASVMPGSAAAEAGVQVGDKIILTDFVPQKEDVKKEN